MTDTVVIPEEKVEGKRLGRHIEHDPRSRDHAFGAVVHPHQLVSVRHRRYGQTFDQGDVGSCTGNAAAGAINTIPIHHAHAIALKEYEAVQIYELATSLDDIPGQYPPDDTGSSGLAVAKAAQQKKYISSYKHAFSVEEALTALQIGPVIIGINWYETFDEPDDTGLVKIGGQVRGGHEIELLGYHAQVIVDDSMLELENSWGPGWGKRGRFFFTVGTFRQLMAEQGDATILVR